MIKHDIILHNLEQRLNNYERYDWIQPKMEYQRNGLIGEIDLLAYDSKYKMYHFYEVKSTLHIKSYNKAQTQFNRFKRAFPGLNVNGILVYDKGVMRLK
jgi:RecB family endonuclease NucS